DSESDDPDVETLEQFYANDQQGDTSSNLAELNTKESESADTDSETAETDSKPADTESETTEEAINDDDILEFGDEPDDLEDEEMMAQFYDTESSDTDTATEESTDGDKKPREVEVVDIDDVDESLGSSVSLDVEDDDDMVTTVTTTTTTYHYHDYHHRRRG
ncbi:MAG: hypothetical protein IJ894_05425, partial [Bacteroidales bacterium]|nr:hypothetical protein [Bacteroidales bacterium]